MMNVIVPLNVSALRVSANDNSNVVNRFKGRVAVFERIPWGSHATEASTGDTIVQQLEQQSGPSNPLGAGVHIHWELPDYFRQGVQQPNGNVVFPQVPNRWLVIRYLSVWNSAANSYDPVTTKSFLVESDYVGAVPWTDAYGVIRPTVSVPLPTNPPLNTQPFMYMGRVLNYEDWNPNAENANQFLPGYRGQNDQPLYLTSIGFVGPGFSSYYPECCSVFGFWDHFKDVTGTDGATINDAITQNLPVQFKVSYQVIGWIDSRWAAPAVSDPLAGLSDAVTGQYNDYVAQCIEQNVMVEETPATVFDNVFQNQFHWKTNTHGIEYTLNPDQTIKTLTVPTGTLVAGIVQEVVWNMLVSPGTTFFLNNPENKQNPALWNDTVEVAVGNTTTEALSAILKFDMSNQDNDPDLLKNYEYLLNALQLGLLQNLEKQPSKTIYLDESLHAKAFSQNSGGWLWIIEQPGSDPDCAPNPNRQVTLPMELAEYLALLNQAQKAYDQGRAALDQMRKQLFMDWIRYVKMYVGNSTNPNIKLSDLENFLLTSSGGELNAVIGAGSATGMVQYLSDPVSGQIVGVQEPTGTDSLAYAVWEKYQAVKKALIDHDAWDLLAVPGPSFFVPTDPVLLLEGDRIEPARRNGRDANIAVRLSADLLSALALQYYGSSFCVPTGDLTGIPNVAPAMPGGADQQALIGEAYLLVPMLAKIVASALKMQGGADNPAVKDFDGFMAALAAAQGGLSPLEGGSTSGLFAAVHAPDYASVANPTQTVNAPMAIDFTFTNGAANGWAPDAVAWNTQQALPEFSDLRFDPFQPVYVIWGAQIDPLQWKNGQSYTQDNLTGYFELDSDAVDYIYSNMVSGAPAPFTTGKSVEYLSSAVLSSKPTYSLASQIESYVENFPGDPADPTLEQIQALYADRHFMSQSISGFNVEQTLRSYIAQIPVLDLAKGGRDQITTQINAAAGASPNDNWYDFSFNSLMPIATGPLAQHNFGPLRAGFMEITYLEIVDVFGQRLQLSTRTLLPDGALKTITALSMQPPETDTVNQDRIYLAPRVLAPTRIWFRWLSADHNNEVSGITDDFIEMNSHPASSPLCGWMLPNHLDNSLFFYNADGSAIGSFGLEHNASVYRTRAGNLTNPTNSLSLDIGSEGSPTVNPHLANFMWYIQMKSADFLKDFLTTVQDSDVFINPESFARDVNLAVLVGRPLALTRAVLSMETSGGVLPLSQADVSPSDPFPRDVNSNRFNYMDRQQESSANLGSVQFPVRMGNLANIDDGLVGYLIEQQGTAPYDTFYSAVAPMGGSHGVIRPSATTIQLTLNASPIILTMLVDPRASVHATTGILPVNELSIPPDQYSTAMATLAMTFFTSPVLCRSQGLVVPVPQESGYNWEWIDPGANSPIALKANAVNGNAVYDYTAQQIFEGWLRLTPTPQTKE